MKTASEQYIAQEEGRARKPVELFHLWMPAARMHWRYTSADDVQVFGGNTFSPAAILRGGISWDTDLSVTVMDVTVGRLTGPATLWLAQNPVDTVWVEVLRLFADQEPKEAGSVFLGLVDTVAFSNAGARVRCVGFESFLARALPVYRYQATCNWRVFDSSCRLNSAAWAVDAEEISVSGDGLVVVAEEFAAYEDGHFIGGTLTSGNFSRMITGHLGQEIRLRYPLPGLQSASSIRVLPGCDGEITTCRDKYSNVINFGGFPYIPLDNPATWRG